MWIIFPPKNATLLRCFKHHRDIFGKIIKKKTAGEHVKWKHFHRLSLRKLVSTNFLEVDLQYITKI